MTLILTCLTNRAVYQVSDRRLTRFAPPHEVVDDHSNKAVCLKGMAAFGYTGITEIDGKRTDNWLSDALVAVPGQDMDQILKRVRDDATMAFAKMPFDSRYKRHAFQGVGWFHVNGSEQLSPGLLTVHHALHRETRDWLPDANSEFAVMTSFPVLVATSLNSTGWGLVRPNLNET